MLLVLAHPCDEGARFLAERWQAQGARLMVPRDLSAPGWRHHVGGGGEEWAIASGERVRVKDMTGVLVRLSGIRDQFLPHIAAFDRTYVAAEMNAFLIAWLTALTCPVLNRPAAGSILGPSLSHERWLAAAARAGLRLAFPRHCAPYVERPQAEVQVTVVGERWFGEVTPALGDQAARLARSVGADLLTAHFYGAEADAAFAGVDLLVDPTRAGVADALLSRLEGTCG